MIRARAFFLLLVAGCSSGSIDRARRMVIYGNDDRTDWYAEPASAVRARMRDSIVAMIGPALLDTSNPRDVQVNAQSYGDAYGLCATEAFRDQPSASDCSGTLIDDDLVLTAGHCAPTLSDCQAENWVFHFYEEAPGRLATLTTDDIFTCKAVVTEKLSDSGGRSDDYAIFQLDRPATPRFVPVGIAPAHAALGDGAPVTLLSYPAGLPAKASTGLVTDGGGGSLLDFFLYTADAYEGSSGGSIFDADGDIVGIEVRGQDDFDRSGSCTVSRVLPDDGGEGSEEGSFAFNAVVDLCAGGWPSARLCTGADAAVTRDGGAARDLGNLPVMKSRGCGCSL